MLELRPTCENCNCKLPPESTIAMICSFECTFCKACVENILHNVCPNCGGGFSLRPIRPQRNLKGENNTAKYPPSEKVRHKPVDRQEHNEFASRIKDIPVSDR